MGWWFTRRFLGRILCARTSSVLTFLGDVKYIQDVLLLVQFVFCCESCNKSLLKHRKLCSKPEISADFLLPPHTHAFPTGRCHPDPVARWCRVYHGMGQCSCCGGWRCQLGETQTPKHETGKGKRWVYRSYFTVWRRCFINNIKHVCLMSNNSLKIKSQDILGPGWVKYLITGFTWWLWISHDEVQVCVTYCWWFRNPKANHLGCKKTL